MRKPVRLYRIPSGRRHRKRTSGQLKIIKVAGFAGAESPEGEKGFCREVPEHSPGADKNAAQKVLRKVQSALQKPEVSRANKEQIKEKARESYQDRLARGKIEADRANRERMERRDRIRPVTKKKDMRNSEAFAFLCGDGRCFLFRKGQYECI